ncbi:MAG TPA: PAS domain-containing protein, partial [Methanoregula sp.]|nr:PAS domain-containing protein [Methanoregula sp.]
MYYHIFYRFIYKASGGRRTTPSSQTNPARDSPEKVPASRCPGTQKRKESDLIASNRKLTLLTQMLFTAYAELQQANDALTAANKKLRQTEDELRKANSGVTEEKKVMTRQRDRIRNLLDIAGVMILALDKEGNVTLINRRGCEILGY